MKSGSRCSVALFWVWASLCCSASVLPVVPQPQQVVSLGSSSSYLSPAPSLSLSCPSSSPCHQLLSAAFDRTVAAAHTWHTSLPRWRLSIHPELDPQQPPVPSASSPLISSVSVVVTSSEDVGVAALPPADGEQADESYEVSASAPEVSVTCRTPWGALRAFETLAQLLEWDEGAGRLYMPRLPLVVRDAPRFRWRGFLVDTSRHYYAPSVLRRFVDAIAAAKMNVLHLHLTDAQSFPLELESRPELAERGAWSRASTYTRQDVAQLVEYARLRGVSVVPEIDMPAHTGSWRAAYPDVVADCWKMLLAKGVTYPENVLALNPASEETWGAMHDIIRETAEMFPTPFFHVGGDEVDEECWRQASQADDILAWMKEHGIESYVELNRQFDRTAQHLAAGAGKQPVVWEDVHTINATEGPETIVMAWRSKAVLASVVRSGRRAILSSGYYQDMQVPLCTSPSQDCHTNWMWSWTHRDMYKNDPTEGLGLTAEQEKLVLGGEASIWSESVDSANLNSRALSRSAGIAERLWSPKTVVDADDLEVRATRFRCLNVRRGISDAGPLVPDTCEVRRI
eukprot:m51a1_g4534 putative beta-hexosaminidase beta chain (570) ;mRNA; f:27662-29601